MEELGVSFPVGSHVFFSLIKKKFANNSFTFLVESADCSGKFLKLL